MTRRSFRQVLIGEQIVGLWGLEEMFDELRAQDRAPEPDLAPLLLEGVERDNYVFPNAHPLYEEALLREYRRYWKEQQEGSQGAEQRPRRLSPRAWRGKAREQVPWYPSIYPERCDGCGDCLTFCEYDVYDWDEASADRLQACLGFWSHCLYKEKQRCMNDLICYCFGYSARDIQEDVNAHDGRSTILEEIVAAKRAGECRCSTTHPEGR